MSDNAGRFWTHEEENRLIDFAIEHDLVTKADLAEWGRNFGRTPVAIESRLRRLRNERRLSFDLEIPTIGALHEDSPFYRPSPSTDSG